MMFFKGVRISGLFILLTIISIFYYVSFGGATNTDQQMDFEQRVNEIKKSKDEKKSGLQINSSLLSSETTDFLGKFLEEHFKDQVAIFIQLKNIKK